MIEPEQFPAPSQPLRVAEQLAGEWVADDAHTLRYWRGSWWLWEGARWIEHEADSLRAWLYRRLGSGVYWQPESKSKPGELVPWAPTKTKIANVTEALAARLHLAATVNTPAWTARRPGDPEGSVIACTNGLLEMDGRRLHPHTPRHFNLVSVPFDYDPAATCPTWLAFLHSLWPRDPDAITALQEWFGYVLSGRTDLQKILLAIGPTRSGKGTIARVQRGLLGGDNVAGPTLASLASNFGLAPLVGKPLAIVADARLGKDTRAVVERLLSISGEDTLDVDRKFKAAWTGRLPTRLMILSNELPGFGDASGAIGGRFIVLTMTSSFLGREDTTLERRLDAEMPGILTWALDGLDRVTTNNRLSEPASSTQAVEQLADLVSPISAFVRERCEVDAAAEEYIDEVWRSWKDWADENSSPASSKQRFSRDLRAVVPSLATGKRGTGKQLTRVFRGLRLRGSNGAALWPDDSERRVETHRDAPFNANTYAHARDLEGQGQELHAESWSSNGELRAFAPLCPTCDQPTDDHLPGCPALEEDA
jgi:putative DNA primase/helicase